MCIQVESSFFFEFIGIVRLEGVFKFLSAALTRVMRAAVPIPAVAAASVLHSAAVGGSVAGDVGAL